KRTKTPLIRQLENRAPAQVVDAHLAVAACNEESLAAHEGGRAAAQVQHPPLSHRQEPRAKDGSSFAVRRDLRRVQRNAESGGRARRDLRQRLRRQLVSMRSSCLRVRRASLDDGVHGDRGDDNERSQCCNCNATCAGTRARNLDCLPPLQQRLREHVVEDLVDRASLADLVDRPKDACPAESLEQRCNASALDAGVAGEIGFAECDLRPGRSDELPDDASSEVTEIVRQRIERLAHVRRGDCLRSTEPGERPLVQLGASRAALLLPDAVEDQLQERGAKAVLHLGLEGVDERVLGGHPFAGDLGERVERPDDRLPRGACSDRLEPKDVPERLGQPAREGIELREGVISNGEENAGPQTGATEKLVQPAEERAVGAVVHEVLLELIEQENDVSVPCGGSGGVGEPGGRTERRRRRANRLDKRIDRALDPRRVDGDDRFSASTKGLRYPRAQQRALSDAACAVQHREAARLEVRDQRVALCIATEEETSVELGVVEARQPLVRPSDHSRRSSSATYAAGARSTSCTSRWRQNSRSTGPGASCTDQERYGNGSCPKRRSSTRRSVQSDSVYPSRSRCDLRSRAVMPTGIRAATSP